MNEATIKFLQAVEEGHYETVKYLLANARLVYEKSPVDDFELLLDKSITIYINSGRAKDAKTALMIAGLEGHLKIMSLLLDYGVDTEISERYHYKTILRLLVEKNKGEALQLLLSHPTNKPDINATRKGMNKTVLHYAIEVNFFSIVELLLEKGANFDLQDLEGNTPLHYAILENKPSIIKLLLEKGAAINIENTQNISSFSYFLKEFPIYTIQYWKNLILPHIIHKIRLSPNAIIALELWYRLGLKQQEIFCALFNTPFWGPEKVNRHYGKVERDSTFEDKIKEKDFFKEFKNNFCITSFAWVIYSFHRFPIEIQSLICAYLFSSILEKHSLTTDHAKGAFTHLISMINAERDSISQPMERYKDVFFKRDHEFNREKPPIPIYYQLAFANKLAFSNNV